MNKIEHTITCPNYEYNMQPENFKNQSRKVVPSKPFDQKLFEHIADIRQTGKHKGIPENITQQSIDMPPLHLAPFQKKGRSLHFFLNQ